MIELRFMRLLSNKLSVSLKGELWQPLNARAAVLAAGNPEYGRYVPERNVTENINLPVTILSRFDLIFIIRDQPEPDIDSRMSEHILALHKTQSHPEAAAFPPDFLRKYVSYARRIAPTLTPEAVKEIQGFYLSMRSRSGAEGAIAITPRQLEALIRIAEARARCFLRNQVTVEDAQGAIRIMRVSLQDAGMDVKTKSIDIDVIMTGKPRSQRDILQRVVDILLELERETGSVEQSVLVSAIVEREKIDEAEARRLIQVLIRDAMLYMPKPGILKRTRG
jgi:replicative DNA helicase Mcm